MATNSKNTSKIKPVGSKNHVQGKSTSKAASKIKKTTSKKIVPKAGQKSEPKSIVKAAAKPKIIAKAPKKEVPDDKKITESSKAFEKKMDEMAQKSTAIQKPKGKSKTFSKTAAAAIIIIVIAAIAYLFYPWKKSSVVKEQITPKEPIPPAAETKVEEPKKDIAKPRAEDETLYKVKYKDQLTEISKQYYGSHKEWKRIYEANKDKINNPDLIFPGQELIIPKIEKKDK